MKKFWHSTLTTTLLYVASTSAFANSGTFLSGVGHAQYTQNITKNTAGTLLVEGGPRNSRASGTFGWAITPCDRIKGTAEWLWQDINYEFTSGNAIQGSNQGAVGLAYQRDFNSEYRDNLNLSAYYSHALSVNLRNRSILPVSVGTDFLLVNNFRHIAGSNVGGAGVGYTTHPWQDTEITVTANWDGVSYEKQYMNKLYINGVGGTGSLSQLFQIKNQLFKAGTTVAWRAPFNSYQLELDWIRPCATSQLLIGVFGYYIQGKHDLPNTSLAGLNLTFVLDRAATRKDTTLRPFMDWMTSPAINMPQVLSVPDEALAQRLFFVPPTT